MSSKTSAPYKWSNLQQEEEVVEEEELRVSPLIEKRGIPEDSENTRHPYNRYHPNRHYSEE
jgi:hypothetical protein